MQLSHEDTLRLKVLLANAEAVRIDDHAMCVFGLSAGREAKVPLNPNCRPESYLRMVREMLSTHVLGSPKGYPVYLRRWTRMGQMQSARLDPLLMLGEPEAVTAVACSPSLTDELAERVWWALPDPEIARYMLERDAVVRGKMGRVLAEYLAEYLPFEQDAHTLIRSVRLVLQPGLLSDEQVGQIWGRGARKNAYYVGFLQARPDALPERKPPRSDWDYQRARLAPLIRAGNVFAAQLAWLLSGPGQTYLQTSVAVLRKPVDQDVVVSLLEALRQYFAPVMPFEVLPGDVEEIVRNADALTRSGSLPDGTPLPPLRELIHAFPDLQPDIAAMMVLTQVGEPVVRPIFSRTTAVGSLMRTKLEPVARPLLERFAVLLGIAG